MNKFLALLNTSNPRNFDRQMAISAFVFSFGIGGIIALYITIVEPQNLKQSEFIVYFGAILSFILFITYRSSRNSSREVTYKYQQPFDRLLEQQRAAEASFITLQKIFKEQQRPYALHEDLESLLSPLLPPFSNALGLSGESNRYSIDIYVFNSQENSMIKFYSTTPHFDNKRIRIGEGYIGITFVGAEGVLIIPNTGNLPKESPFTDLYTTSAEFPERSIMAVAFGHPYNLDQRGVLAITTDRSNHFDDTYKLLCMTYSSMLSTYFSNFIKP